MDFDEYMDSIQGDFSDIEEKRRSSTMPDLERAPGKADNWIEKAGGLPKYIERIAKHLHYEQGMSIGHAIAAAVNTVKRWAKGGGNVSASTVAKAQAALAEWEAKKAKGKKDIVGSQDGMTLDGIEYKNVSVKGLQVADGDTGIVEAIVSVTGIVDEVKDIIRPGAYAKTLAKRTPKGVYSHSWDQPVSKTLDIKELLPGDPNLPKSLADGRPWPREAGALWVKMQFNLETERGRNAFSDVKFYGDDQEWSIGYNVPPAGAKVNPKMGVREIDYLDLFEYSPVLFGAMPMAVTQSVKSAQTAYKAMQGNAASWANQQAEDQVGVYEVDEDGLREADLDEYTAVDAEDVGMKALFGPDDFDVVVKALNALNELLGTATGTKEHSQVPGDEVSDHKEPSTVTQAVDTWLDGDEEMKAPAEALDEALSASDDEALEVAANDFLDTVESRMDEADGSESNALTRVAKLVATLIEAAAAKSPPSEESTHEKSLLAPEAVWDDEDFDDDDADADDGDDDTEVVDLSDLERFRAALDS